MAPTSEPQLRVGCSGYDYSHWRGVLYPPDAPHEQWFDLYAERFGCVEINNTFYNLPEPRVFEEWRDRAPPGFRYALKMSRYGTHMKKLKDPDEWVGNFLQRAERLKSHLGPVLVQLPPRWGADPRRLAAFLDRAPSRIRWAIEFRDEGWLRDDIYDLLGEHDAAMCIHDLIDDHPTVPAASWMYLRFHGPSSSARYEGRYPHQTLAAHADRIARWIDEGRDVYAFFNNDLGGAAVRDAADLEKYVKQRCPSHTA